MSLYEDIKTGLEQAIVYEKMGIKLNRAYSGGWDNIEYPIYQLSDESYLCIAYSSNHKCYYIDVYTKEDFIEQGFCEEPGLDYIFENMVRQDIDR